MSIVVVGMADYKIARPPDQLMTAGLGSCIGLCVYDPHARIGGMAHVMLPTSEGMSGSNLMKYADTCVKLMMDELARQGVSKTRLKAKMAGGAQMFTFAGKNPTMRIGERNAEAVSEQLRKYGIPLLGSDVGGNAGRTITFDVGSGDLHIRTIKHGEKVI